MKSVKSEMEPSEDLGDDRSSSLSEPDDDPDEEMQFNALTASRRSALNDVAPAASEVDSEAETERLEQTPRTVRRRAGSMERTPSKLGQPMPLDDDLSEPPSPLPAEPGGDSSTSNGIPAGKKRKRSETGESPLTSADSDLEESPHKRSHESLENQLRNESSKRNTKEQDTEIRSPDPLDASAATPSRAGGRNKAGKLRERTKKELAKDSEVDSVESIAGVEEEQSEDKSIGSTEELRHKLAASSLYEDLAKQFTAFRDKLYNERLATVTTELEMLNQADCRHPEYLRQVACIDSRYTKQVNETQAFYRFKMQCLRKSTLAQRSQTLSQYCQTARQLREDVMYKLGEEWYNIQTERRHFGQDKDEKYLFKIPSKKSDQIRQQAKYNQEVSILSGVAKYVGFPAAPEICGADADALEEDLKSMKVAKRPHQSTGHPHAMNWTFGQGKNERLAHEQYIEQHAWARPQGSILHHTTPNLKHTADWAEPRPQTFSQTVMPPVKSNGVEATHISENPFTTPMAQRRVAAMESSSSSTVPANSDPVEPPSSVVAAPPTIDRIRLGRQPPRDAGSPLAIAKQRQTPSEFPGWRNASNASGTSTIDAGPDSAEKARLGPRADVAHPDEGPHDNYTSGVQHQPHPLFDIAQLHRADRVPPHDLHTSAGFRPQESPFHAPAAPPSASARHS